MPESLPSYGGQALIEGVMMRGASTCAMAVRTPEGSILVETETLGRLYRSRMARIPFLRGLLLLWDALVLGMRALTFSANVQADEDEKIEGTSLTLTVLASLAAGIGLFFLLPAGAAHLTIEFLGLSAALSNIIEGLVRLALLIGYIAAIGRIPEIGRVFGYHGAEHKTINAYEAGAPLTVESIKTYPLEHPRCGTAFLLTVVVFSILAFSLLGPLPLHLRLLSRVALLPFLAAISYEYIRLSARLIARPWARWLFAPNLALQRLTTREPDAAMLEVAIASFEAMRAQENPQTVEIPEPVI